MKILRRLLDRRSKANSVNLRSGMQFVVITGHQRSGTSVFRAALARHPEIYDFGEVMTPLREAKSDPASFFIFLNNRKSAPSGARHLKSGEAWDAVASYFRHLKNLSDAKYGMIDIKIDFLHNFDPVSKMPAAEPLIFSFLKKNNIPILHFHRKDTLDQFVSLRIGWKTAKWHFDKNSNEELSVEPFTLEVDEAIKNIQSMQRSSELVDNWLFNYENGYKFFYEDMYINQKITPFYEDIARSIFCLESDFDIELPYKQTPIDPRATVINYADLKERVAELSLINT